MADSGEVRAQGTIARRVLRNTGLPGIGKAAGAVLHLAAPGAGGRGFSGRPNGARGVGAAAALGFFAAFGAMLAADHHLRPARSG
jgi:hypothetical protein